MLTAEERTRIRQLRVAFGPDPHNDLDANVDWWSEEDGIPFDDTLFECGRSDHRREAVREAATARRRR